MNEPITDAATETLALAPAPRPKQAKGFAVMDPEKQREIARLGGQAAHQKGTAHEWTSQEAAEAGRKGGATRKRKPKDKAAA